MKRILIIGGDRRQFVLGDMLKRKKHHVCLVGFAKLGAADEEMDAPDYVILPVPYRNPDGTIKTPYSDQTLTLESVVRRYPNSAYVLGGCDQAAKAVVDGAGIRCFDLLADEAFLVRNALLTAQAAVCAYEKASENALCDTNCVVVGYGRISKFLCRLLKAYGASVTATARKSSDLALIQAESMQAVKTSDIQQVLSIADVIFNTVPVHILGEAELCTMKQGAMYIELASPPYGVDLKLAERYQVNVRLEQNLPGRYFPVSAARAILHALEREEL